MWQWTWWRTIWNLGADLQLFVENNNQQTVWVQYIEYPDVQTKSNEICWCNQLSGEQWTDNSLVLRGSHLKIRTGQQSAYKSCHSAAPLYSSLTALRRCRRQLQLRPRKFRIAATVARVVAILPLNLPLNLAKKVVYCCRQIFYQLPRLDWTNFCCLYIYHVFLNHSLFGAVLSWDPP